MSPFTFQGHDIRALKMAIPHQSVVPSNIMWLASIRTGVTVSRWPETPAP